MGGQARFRRSPALLVEWLGRDIVVVDTTAMRRTRIDPRLVAALAMLDDWRSVDDLIALGADITGESLQRLAAAGVVEQSSESQAPPGPGDARDPRLVWNPFDLAVQRNMSRGGLREHELDWESPPLRRARPGDTTVQLPPPLQSLQAPFSDVVAARRSLRRYGARALTQEELSTLLHHAARVAVARPETEPVEALRPFAGAGARSELEIYCVADRVAGLRPGVYRFDPFAHDLEHVRDRDGDTVAFLDGVSAAAGGLEQLPPLTLLITAVFGRIMQRYDWIGLSLIYRDCGCLLQTLYLVATAMDLAPCAIGTGAEFANSRWLGLDPMVEAQVGCFIVGPRE